MSLDSTDDRYAAPALSSGAPPPRTPSYRKLGIGLQGGGGVVGFSNSEMRQLAEHGGYWDARLAVGLKQIFAIELAYIGAVHPVDAPGLGSGANLVGNGAEGDLRINIPIIQDRAFVAPYVLGGLGWMHYNVSGAPNDGSMLASTDDIATIPVGAGITVGHGHLYLDARFVYRFTAYEDLVRAPDHGDNQLRQWTFGGSVGFLF
jgi:hypothetical protein